MEKWDINKQVVMLGSDFEWLRIYKTDHSNNDLEFVIREYTHAAVYYMGVPQVKNLVDKLNLWLSEQ